jgi:hypothetical protein
MCTASTLLDEFTKGMASSGAAAPSLAPVNPELHGPVTYQLVGHGQCVEQFGPGEPYMPVLEAIGRLGRGANGPAVIETMRRHAPEWLALIPGLLSPQ